MHRRLAIALQDLMTPNDTKMPPVGLPILCGWSDCACLKATEATEATCSLIGTSESFFA